MIYILASLVVAFYVSGLILFRAFVNTNEASAKWYEYAFWPYVPICAIIEAIREKRFEW